MRSKNLFQITKCCFLDENWKCERLECRCLIARSKILSGTQFARRAFILCILSASDVEALGSEPGGLRIIVVKTPVSRDWRIALSAPLAAGPQMGQSGNHSWQQGAPKQPPGAAREVPLLPAGRAWGAGEHKLGSSCVPMAIIGVCFVGTGGMWLGYNTGAHTAALQVHKMFLHPSTAIICNWSKGACDEKH